MWLRAWTITEIIRYSFYFSLSLSLSLSVSFDVSFPKGGKHGFLLNTELYLACFLFVLDNNFHKKQQMCCQIQYIWSNLVNNNVLSVIVWCENVFCSFIYLNKSYFCLKTDPAGGSSSHVAECLDHHRDHQIQLLLLQPAAWPCALCSGLDEVCGIVLISRVKFRILADI